MGRSIEAMLADLAPLNQQQEVVKKELESFISQTRHCGNINGLLVGALKGACAELSVCAGPYPQMLKDAAVISARTILEDGLKVAGEKG